MSTSTLKLWYCLLSFGEHPIFGQISRVEVQPNMIVFDVMERIVQRHFPTGTPPNLRLYKGRTPIMIQDFDRISISLSDLGDPLLPNVNLANIFHQPPANDFLHIIALNYDQPVSVECWIRKIDRPTMLGLSPPITGPVNVSVPLQTTGENLLPFVKEKRPDLLALPDDMKLYRFQYGNKEERDHILSSNLGDSIDEAQDLLMVFSRFPLTEPLRIIIEVQERKRARSSDTMEEEMKNALKKIKIAPSSITASDHQDLQKGGLLFDYRLPASREGGSEYQSKIKEFPPIELLYEGFGHFLDSYRSCHDTDCSNGSADRNKVELFIELMSKNFSNELHRRNAGLSVLNDMFTDLFHGLEAITPGDIGNASTDGHYTYGKYGLPCFIVEFKNEAAGSKAIPMSQLSAYYRGIARATMDKSSQLYPRSRFPALGLTAVGPVVTFYAMITVGPTVCSALTPGLSCVPYATGGHDRLALLAAFSAAQRLLSQIQEDAKKLSDAMMLLPVIGKHKFPYIKELRFIENPDTPVEIKITKLLHAHFDRFVYLAESDRPLVIKVTRTYGDDLHRFCADRGHAPTLYAVQEIPGKLKVVAMEYLDIQSSSFDGTEEYRKGLGEQMLQLVKQFHAEDFVHGDLREPNLCCVDGRMKVLDFDWGGKVGEASYPTSRLTSELTRGRGMDDLKITKDDDVRVLENTLRSLKCL